MAAIATADRRVLADELAQLERENRDQVQALNSKLREAEAALSQAEAAAKAARTALLGARTALGRVNLDFDRRRSQLEHDLRAGAPTALGEFRTLCLVRLRECSIGDHREIAARRVKSDTLTAVLRVLDGLELEPNAMVIERRVKGMRETISA